MKSVRTTNVGACKVTAYRILESGLRNYGVDLPDGTDVLVQDQENSLNADRIAAAFSPFVAGPGCVRFAAGQFLALNKRADGLASSCHARHDDWGHLSEALAAIGLRINPTPKHDEHGLYWELSE